ncbi:hypothetical protein [Streptomyces paromomycinus]|uniref:Uncharacterized protein n=1 Tax=Streptomyces paromomycinus TaxID=92743 RepID=A0A401VU29_STREY|nr:hypothetical protein [Streptomyces paromomycinus]GCD40598.1 hypothetical protein GKJPGBOP_00251 [Streptomyces paromomycinus]
MSGGKRILVDESEWFRIQREASRQKDVLRNVPALIREIRRQTQDDLERVFGVMEDRQRSVEQVVEGLSEQTRRLETETQQRLRAQARRMAEDLRATAEELRGDMRRQLADQQRRLRSEIAAERDQRRADIRRIDTELGELVQDREHAAVVARAALSDARAMHGLVLGTLPHERYAPGRLQSLEATLDRAGENIAQGRFDAALATAQAAYQELGELRLELEHREREREVLRAQARGELLLVHLLIEDSARQNARDEHGEVLDGYDLDVDYWTHGEFATLRKETEELRHRIEDDERPLSADELRELLEHRSPALQERLARLVQRAGGRQLASQQRVNLAEAVVRTLEGMTAYELDATTYLGGDQRDAFFARLVHGNRNAIVVEVAPAGPDSGASVLRVLSYDHDTAARTELEERGAGLMRALRGQGFPAAAPQEEAGTPDPAYADFATLSEPRALPDSEPPPLSRTEQRVLPQASTETEPG